MKEIVYAIKFQLEESGYADKLGAGIVLTGGGALLKNLSQLINAITGQDVIIGFPREHIAGPFKEEVNQPMFSTAVGLLMRYDKILLEEQHEAEIPDVIPEEPETEEEEDHEEEEKPKKSANSLFKRFTTTIKKALEEEDDEFDND